MSRARADVVITGQVVVAAGSAGLETAEALAIGGGRIVAVGSRQEILEGASGARVIRADDAAIVPGLHDFHLHLVGMARAARTLDLSPARTMDAVLDLVATAVAGSAAGEWLHGEGWWAEALDRAQLGRLEALVAGRPAFLTSHDRHSAWASGAALTVAGVGAGVVDPPGGRFERGADGAPDGVVRETAKDLVADRAGRLTGPSLTAALVEVAHDLAALGITGATDAGDPSTENGRGAHADLGDSFSSLAEAAEGLAGHLRLTVDMPAAALEAAAERGFRFGTPLTRDGSIRVGWAKLYADGALGSRTAALLEPYGCAGAEDPAHSGILRVSSDELADRLGQGARGGIALAIHAIGDRAAAMVLDGIAAEVEGGASGTAPRPAHRIEHLQLIRTSDRDRLAALGVTASLQPVHLPSDGETAERCWGDRLADAYPWRSLAASGTLIALGSDAPIESANPWLGVLAAVRRRAPGGAAPTWGADQALDPATAIGAYTLGPALAVGRTDLGHLRPGALADLAVLNVDLGTLIAVDDRLAGVRSHLTLVDGKEVHLG